MLLWKQFRKYMERIDIHDSIWSIDSSSGFCRFGGCRTCLRNMGSEMIRALFLLLHIRFLHTPLWNHTLIEDGHEGGIFMVICLVVGTLLLVVLAILVVKLLVEVIAQIISRVIEIRKQFKKAMAEEEEPA